MSTSTEPAWVSVLKDQLKEHPKAVTYALSTVAQDGKPRNRFVIHRSITPKSSFLILTTDTRMRKPAELLQNPSIEIAWWIEEPNVQFRILGQAYSIPPLTASSNTLEVQGIIDKLQPNDEEKEVVWWENERLRQWGQMSGHLRASFARPTPGTLLRDHKEDPKDWVESIPEKSDDPKVQETIERAKTHFSLIAIRPSSFEFIELKCIPNRRTLWTRREDGSWEKASLVP